MKTITVSLPDDYALDIETRVAKGEYESMDEAVTVAVADWLCMLDTPSMIDEDDPRLRAMIQSAAEQVERGEVVELEEAMARLSARTRAKLALLRVPS